jgi:hypothetical protein
MADSKRWSADPAPRDEAQAAKTEALLALRDTLNKHAHALETNPDWARNYSMLRAIDSALIRAYHHTRPPTASDDQAPAAH